jgi:hypothetical protein
MYFELAYFLGAGIIFGASEQAEHQVALTPRDGRSAPASYLSRII